MQAQNAKLKKEFIELRDRLSECLQRVKERRKETIYEKSKEDLDREEEIKSLTQKIDCYKKQIQKAKHELSTDFNLGK